MEDRIETLRDTIRQAQRYLGGIMDDLDAGDYGPTEAAEDLEALTGNSPVLSHVIDAIGEVARYEH